MKWYILSLALLLASNIIQAAELQVKSEPMQLDSSACHCQPADYEEMEALLDEANIDLYPIDFSARSQKPLGGLKLASPIKSTSTPPLF